MSTERARALLALARAAISRALGLPGPTIAVPEWMREPGACFVTLTQRGRLRGCIGTVLVHRSLREDLEFNAVAAALHDHRFTPLTATELADTDIEVSLLSPLQDMRFASEADALAQLRPGVDGVVFQWGALRSTFLPQVWEQLPQPALFMANLKAKAGLSEDFWAPDVRLRRYTVEKFRESDLKAPDAAHQRSHA